MNERATAKAVVTGASSVVTTKSPKRQAAREATKTARNEYSVLRNSTEPDLICADRRSISGSPMSLPVLYDQILVYRKKMKMNERAAAPNAGCVAEDIASAKVVIANR